MASQQMKLTLTLLSAVILALPHMARAQELTSVAIFGSSVYGASAQEIYRITEDGNVFKAINRNQMEKGPIGSYSASEALLVVQLATGNLQLSSDQGITWKQIAPPKGVKTRWVKVAGSELFLLSMEGKDGRSESIGSLFVSSDQGENWKKMPLANVRSLGIDGNNFYVAGVKGSRDSTKSTVYLSINRGKNWKEIGVGPSSSFSVSDPFLVGGENIIFGWPQSVIVFFPKQVRRMELNVDPAWGDYPIHLLAFASKGTEFFASIHWVGLFRSTNEGQSWVKINNGIGKINEGTNSGFVVGSLAADSTKLYAVSSNGMLYISKDDGEYWIPSKAQGAQMAVIGQNEEKAKTRAEAVALKIKDHEAKRANPIFVEMVRMQMKSAATNYFHGAAEMSYSNFGAALAHFSLAIQAQPEFAEAFKGRAACYRQMKQPENALADLLEAANIGLYPTNWESVEFDEIYQRVKRETEDADQDAHYEYYCRDAMGWYMRGAKAKLIVDALEYLTKAIRLSPDQAYFYLKRGSIHAWAHNLAEAKADFKKAVEIDPKIRKDCDATSSYRCPKCNGTGKATVEKQVVVRANRAADGTYSRAGDGSYTFRENGRVVTEGQDLAVDCPDCKKGRISFDWAQYGEYR